MDEPECFGKFGWRDGWTAHERYAVRKVLRRFRLPPILALPCYNECTFSGRCIKESGAVAAKAGDTYVNNYFDAKEQRRTSDGRTE